MKRMIKEEVRPKENGRIKLNIGIEIIAIKDRNQDNKNYQLNL